MSSWDEHINSLLESKSVQDAAIIALSDGSICANSPNFNLTTHAVELNDEKGSKHTANVNEIEIIQKLVNNKGIVPSPPGIWINNQTYHLIRWDEELNVASLKSATGGATVMKTNKCIILGTWDKNANKGAGNCNIAVVQLGETFLSVGY